MFLTLLLGHYYLPAMLPNPTIPSECYSVPLQQQGCPRAPGLEDYMFDTVLVCL